ncbi:surfactin synthase thioesterase subunit [Janthinobacterium sp. CG_23.3]|uniref:thioesterase II family protein n=1 Tax=Janthinobacterium sp. CG_23.3 TaxID=3349634 RepID=UPI0038D40E74
MVADSASITLLCLPNAGASATMYLRWRRLLPAWIGLTPMELPGRGVRSGEALVQDYDTLLAQLCDEYLRLPPRPYALFGHSMGGLLAYGMARRLRQLGGGRAPRALLVSASAAPSCRDTLVFTPDDDQALVAELRRQGGTPEAVFDSGELMQMILPTMRADYRVCASFCFDAAAPPLDMPLWVMAGRNDRYTAPQMQAWRREAGSDFGLEWYDGGHFYLRGQAQERQLMQALERALALRQPALCP